MSWKSQMSQFPGPGSKLGGAGIGRIRKTGGRCRNRKTLMGRIAMKHPLPVGGNQRVRRALRAVRIIGTSKLIRENEKCRRVPEVPGDLASCSQFVFVARGSQHTFWSHNAWDNEFGLCWCKRHGGFLVRSHVLVSGWPFTETGRAYTDSQDL